MVDVNLQKQPGAPYDPYIHQSGVRLPGQSGGRVWQGGGGPSPNPRIVVNLVGDTGEIYLVLCMIIAYCVYMRTYQ